VKNIALHTARNVIIVGRRAISGGSGCLRKFSKIMAIRSLWFKLKMQMSNLYLLGNILG